MASKLCPCGVQLHLVETQATTNIKTAAIFPINHSDDAQVMNQPLGKGSLNQLAKSVESAFLMSSQHFLISELLQIIMQR